MKLRIRGNSLRLRLTKSEVLRIGACERVEETISFGGASQSRLTYALIPSRDTKEPTAQFNGSTVAVSVPEALARAWATGNEVGFEHSQAIGGGHSLKILVEKDWVCLTGRDNEDESDAYPHPHAGGSHAKCN
ncbi:MAG: hypothetical protein FWD69_03775 [Polyangiaceae bacterium]|nr:hypothetical protein [Polyangiaceae bacterium]